MSSSSQSHSHSSDREEVTESAAGQSGSSSAAGGQLSVPRSVVRSASAEDVTSHSALTTKFKRERFLKRQQCQEAAEAEETESAPAPGDTAPAPVSPPPQKIVKQHSHPLLSPASSQLKEEPQDENTPAPPSSVSSTPARQPSLDPLCGLESVPLLYSSSGPRLSPTNIFRPVLPTVRIIPDTEHSSPGHGADNETGADTASLSPISGHHLSPVTSGAQLYPGHHHPQSLLHPEVSNEKTNVYFIVKYNL